MRWCLGAAPAHREPVIIAWQDSSGNLGLSEDVGQPQPPAVSQLRPLLIGPRCLLLEALPQGVGRAGLLCWALGAQGSWAHRVLVAIEHRLRARGSPEAEAPGAAGNWSWRSQSNEDLRNLWRWERRRWARLREGSFSPFRWHFMEEEKLIWGRGCGGRPNRFPQYNGYLFFWGTSQALFEDEWSMVAVGLGSGITRPGFESDSHTWLGGKRWRPLYLSRSREPHLWNGG